VALQLPLKRFYYDVFLPIKLPEDILSFNLLIFVFSGKARYTSNDNVVEEKWI